MVKIHCYKVNGKVHPITYQDFIDTYKNKKKAQQDWQYCREQLKNNGQIYGSGKLYKFTRDKDNIFYFVNGIPKDKLKNIIKPITNTNSRLNLIEIKTKYRKQGEEFNQEINCFVKEIYPAKELFEGLFGDCVSKFLNITKNKKKIVLLDNDEIKVSSDNIRLFKTKGLKCSKCGIEGKYFYKCRNVNDTNYHLELFAEKDGKLIKMTKDHILPESKGGTSHLANLQPMCFDCNCNKGSEESLQDKLNGLSREELCLSKLNAIRIFCEKNLNSKMNKQDLVREVLNIIKANDEKKLVKDKSILNKLRKILGIK